MSATPAPDVERTIEHATTEDVTPVRLSAEALDSTAPEYLRDLKRELNREGLYPAGLSVRADFDADCSIATQHEVDRVRGYVRAASFLGAGRLTVQVSEIACEEKVRPALEACAERAEREGISFEVDGPVSL